MTIMIFGLLDGRTGRLRDHQRIVRPSINLVQSRLDICLSDSVSSAEVRFIQESNKKGCVLFNQRPGQLQR